MQERDTVEENNMCINKTHTECSKKNNKFVNFLECKYVLETYYDGEGLKIDRFFDNICIVTRTLSNTGDLEDF